MSTPLPNVTVTENYFNNANYINVRKPCFKPRLYNHNVKTRLHLGHLADALSKATYNKYIGHKKVNQVPSTYKSLG